MPLARGVSCVRPSGEVKLRMGATERARRCAGVALVFVALWVGADLLASRLHPTPGVSAWYPGAGLTILLFYRCGVRYAPLVVAAELARWSLHHTAAFTWWAAALEGAIAAAVYGATVLALERWGVRLPLARARDTAVFCACAAVAAPALAAALSVGLLIAIGDLPADRFAALFRTFWLGDAVGILSVVPLVAWIVSRVRGQEPPVYRRMLHVRAEIVLVVAVALLGLVAFGVYSLDPLRLVAFGGTFVPLAVLAWSTGPRGAILGSVALDVTLLAANALSRVPEAAVANGQLDVVLQSVLALTAGAVAAERVRDGALVRFLTYHDIRTSLPNRLALDRWAREHSGGDTWLLAISLDRFGVLDVGMESASADALLHEAASRIARAVPERSYLARFESVAFVVAGDGTVRDGRAAAEAIAADFRRPFVSSGVPIHVSASVGVAGGRRNPRVLMIEAHAAMRDARENGGNRIVVFAPPSVPVGAHLIAELSRARDRSEFVMHYQPIFRLDGDGAVAGFEALLRWRHPTLGLLSPSAFLKELESSALLEEIEPWIAQDAFATAARLLAPGMSLWLNVGAASLLDPTYVANTLRIAEATGLGTSRLVIEVTERIVARSDVLGPIVASIVAAGAALAIDDFGTGQSSLDRLRTVPARYLKLDRSLVAPVDADERARALAAGTLQLAHGLGAGVVAEGIENAEQADFFRRLGCEYGQGYALCRPMGAETLEAYMRDRARLEPRR